MSTFKPPYLHPNNTPSPSKAPDNISKNSPSATKLKRHMGVSESRGPKYSTLNSRILIIY